MTARSFIGVAAAILALFLPGGCAPSVACRGHLVIAGGAVRPDNDLIYSHFVAPLPPDAVIGIISTASANPGDSAAASARTIARYAGGRRIEQFAISVDQPTLASDPEVVRRLRECTALWFTGGVQSRITAVFRPPTGDTPAYAAAKEVLSRGGVVGGTSAGAAMMSDPMITGGSSNDALAGVVRVDPDDSGFGMARGMGFFPFGLTDQHFLRRGRLGRLVVALERAGVKHGYGVEEDAAIAVDLASGKITAIGPVVVVDASGINRQGRGITGVRLALLNSGDIVDGPTGRIEHQEPARPEGSKASDAPPDPLPSAWSQGAVTRALDSIAQGRSETVELESESWVLELGRTPDTRVWHGSAATSISGVSLRLIPREANARPPTVGQTPR